MRRSYQIDLTKRWRALGSVITVLALLSALGDSGRAALRYDRAAIGAGQCWRLVTGNLVHLDWPHWAMNVAALVLLWSLFVAEYSMAQWCILSMLSALAVSFGLWWFDPQIEWYVGLSGVLHALMCAGCVALVRRRRWEGAVLLALVVLKIGYEQLAGALPWHASAMRARVVVDAHLYGAIAGLIVGAYFAARKPRPDAASPL
jgi:rhomboid family GlyGly-CTERM serine protease